MLQYYEKVRILSSTQFADHVGKIGVVLGISKDEKQIYGYSIFFDGEDEGLGFLPEELEGTGELVNRSEFYDDEERVIVHVNGDEGSIITVPNYGDSALNSIYGGNK